VNKYTLKSKVSEVYANPIGRDIVDKLVLQTGISEKLLKNPLTMNMKLETLSARFGKKQDAGFADAVLALLNSEQNECYKGPPDKERKWWKESIFYQIYPRSFYDTDGDGIGDIPGITAKLDYLKDLGVDALWLCPIYDSPQDDNGYDIRDYQAIDPVFGTMEEFDTLLMEAHKRGMRLIMDLVVNHTSDEHEWFKQATAGPESMYREYYHFKKSAEDNPPNNWLSFFSGPAWKKMDDNGDWALCLFSKKQMDLNWDTPEMRQDIYKIIRWWLEKGVDGFRLDVINLISKTRGLPDGNEFIGELMRFRGIEHYFYGPHLHEYLHEMRTEAFEPFDAFTVGETPGIGLESGKLLTAPARRELDMIFSFDHLEMPGKSRFDEYTYDAAFLKVYYSRWMADYAGECAMSLFYDNHDNPRMLSKIDPDGKYRDMLAKLLGVLQFTLRGTPFIYQGQELGAVNVRFESIGEMRDVESINLYNELITGMSEDDALGKVISCTRDHARIPVQWDDTVNSGFTAGKPWIKTVSDGYDAQSQSIDGGSILSFYKKLAQLRKNNDALIYGDIDVLKTERHVFAYIRKSGSKKYYIECNLSPDSKSRLAKRPGGKLVLSNCSKHSKAMQGFEAGIYEV